MTMIRTLTATVVLAAMTVPAASAHASSAASSSPAAVADLRIHWQYDTPPAPVLRQTVNFATTAPHASGVLERSIDTTSLGVVDDLELIYSTTGDTWNVARVQMYADGSCTGAVGELTDAPLTPTVDGCAAAVEVIDTWNPIHRLPVRKNLTSFTRGSDGSWEATVTRGKGAKRIDMEFEYRGSDYYSTTSAVGMLRGMPYALEIDVQVQ